MLFGNELTHKGTVSGDAFGAFGHWEKQCARKGE
jgi:hypothetical protein